jgi:hypothetical protein
MKEIPHIRTPKLLPWLAREAGIGERRAETLWREALRHAGIRDPESARSDQWAAAVARLRVLLSAESSREDVASFGWRPWSRALAGVLATRMEALDAFTQGSVRAWRILGQRGFGACCH